MPDIIACPSCAGKLRIPDDLQGRKVRCPACNHTFDAPAHPNSSAAAFRAPLDLTIEEPDSSSPARSGSSLSLVGAVELTPSTDQPPTFPEKPSKPPPRLDRSDRDQLNLRRSRPRPDAEPDRGAVVLALGIISLALVLIWCASPLGAILGLTAWIMGRKDLRKMKNGQMDDQNRNMTQAGWICGILGTALNGLMVLGCGLFIGVMVYSEASRSSNTQPIRVQPPAQRRMIPPPNNPPRKNF